MQTRKVKRIYPMQIALMILLGHSRRGPVQARKKALKNLILTQYLSQAPVVT